MVKQGNLGIPLPPNSPDLHQTQNQKMKSWTDLCAHFTPLKLSKRSQIPHPSPRTASTPQKTKTNNIQILHTQNFTILFAIGLRKSSQTPGVTKGNPEPTSSPYSLEQHQNHKNWMVKCFLRSAKF